MSEMILLYRPDASGRVVAFVPRITPSVVTSEGGRKMVATPGHGRYPIVRGTVPDVRVYPEDEAREYREINAEIARLQARLLALHEEAWRRAECLRVADLAPKP